MSKFKSLTRGQLAKRNLAWQDNFFDHRLRQSGKIEGFAKYVFLNPYRRGLIHCREIWPWWKLKPGVQLGFVGMLVDGKYPREPWLGAANSVLQLIEEDMESSARPKGSD